VRYITYIVFVLLALYISSLLGMSRHGNFSNLLIFGVIILGAIFLLNKRQCLALGVIGLFSGIVGSAMVWTCGSLFGKGDPSGYGMLGTLLGFCLIPTGGVLVFVGWCKKET
jgi:hypothetical protein